jgi:pilus assembly protein CpaC
MGLFSTGAGNIFGAIGTQQFGSVTGNVGAVPGGAGGGGASAPNVASGGIGRTNAGTPGSFGLTDLLNIFIFRPDLNLGTAIRALQQKNLLQVLAEPNVMAMHGTEASFLAGGEFPFPIVQNSSGAQAVTIQFKEFGVRLNFTPQVMPDGLIRLKVSPEVSALDFANGLSISGFFIPALSSRKATAEVELRDGQSFAIAGLIDNRLTEVASKVPILGDVPIIGNLFRSKSENKAKTELLVMVTPRLISGTTPGQLPPLPEYPKPFLDVDRFDGRTGESPTQP